MIHSNDIIPTPKGWCDSGDTAFFGTVFRYNDFPEETAVFAEYAEKAGFVFTESENGNITFSENPLFHKGEYRIDILNSGEIRLFAADREGAGYALSTFLQLCTKVEEKLLLPIGCVFDMPELDYRGLLIDTARSFHPLALLKKYIDLCWFYKIKYLHIHFTDDETFTLPIKKFPKLSTEGKCYTTEEIAELDGYAFSRGVQIVPETDTPGHSTTYQTAYPKIFDSKGIIGFHKDAIESVSDVISEICEMFPHSDYIHIGGDESRLGWWLACDECIEYGRSLGIKVEDDAPGMSGNEYVMLRYLAYFIEKNAETVRSHGKRPIVWEGFHKATNDMLGKDLTVMVFDSSYQTAGSLIESGFDVINCSWLPTYVVTPTWYYSEKDCFSWNVRSFGTINPGSPYYNGMMQMEDSQKIIGGQLSSWGDTVEKSFPSKEDGQHDEWEKICERLPAIAENTWNKKKRCDFSDFSEKSVISRKICKKIVDFE